MSSVVETSLAIMSEERKTPEMRATMSDIERLRHSTAHVLATAILKIWPGAQFAAGPPVDNGFYYDVDLSHRRLHRSLRRAACQAHRKHRRVQAHQRRKRLLQRRRKESTAPAHLWHSVQNEKGAR